MALRRPRMPARVHDDAAERVGRLCSPTGAAATPLCGGTGKLSSRAYTHMSALNRTPAACLSRQGSFTALHLAAYNGGTACVKYLIVLGADTDARKEARCNAAASVPEVARLPGRLLVGRRDDSRSQVARFARSERTSCLCRLVCQDGQTPLRLAAQDGHLACMRLLIHDGGADVNSVDNAVNAHTLLLKERFHS